MQSVWASHSGWKKSQAGVDLFGAKDGKPIAFCEAIGSVPSVPMNSASAHPVSPIQVSDRPASAAPLISAADSVEPAWTMTASGLRSAIFWASAR